MRARLQLGFAALCVLDGSAWLVDEWHGGILQGARQLAVHSAVLAAIFLLMSRGKASGHPRWGSIAGWGSVLIALPAVVSAGAAGQVSRLTGVLVFTLVPVVVIFVVAQLGRGFGDGGGELRLLGPALIGVAGLALLVPFSLPGSLRGASWLSAILVTAVLAGIASVRLHMLLAELDVLRGAAVISAAAGVLAGAFAWMGSAGPLQTDAVSWVVEAARCLLLDAPMVLLTVWLLQALKPVTLAARYLLVPLVTILEGVVIVRPELTWTLGAGLGLAAAGGLLVLRGDEEEEQGEIPAEL